jgi:hypothetical protein
LYAGEKIPFENVPLHDSCSFAIHSGLKKVFPGRFTKHSPAAIELHVTMDLLTCSIDYFALTADTLSKRLHAPAPEKLNNTLTLEDAGYFDRARMMNIEKNGGFVIGQAACSINPVIKLAYGY